MLKTALFDCAINENVAVLTEDRAFALFFRPHPGGFDSSRVPTSGNLPSKAKKMLMPGGGGGWAQVELTDALFSLSLWLHGQIDGHWFCNGKNICVNTD